MMWRSPIVVLALIFLLCRLQTGLGIATLIQVDPASGSFIDNFVGAKNITLFCEVVLESEMVKTEWFLRTEDDIQSNRQPGSLLGDKRFIVTGDVVVSGGVDVSLNTNMTIVEMTAELDGAVMFCGGGDVNFLGNFSLRAYKPPLLNDSLLFTRRENEAFLVDLSTGNRPAFPTPTSFSWSRTGGGAVGNTTERGYGYPFVRIRYVQPSDTGNYTLTATNYLPDGTAVGTDSGSFYLNVLFGASLTRGDVTVAVLEGRTVSLLCGRELRGNPTPQVEWRNNTGFRISDGGRYTFSMGQAEVRLAVADAVRGDTGNWTCSAQVFQIGTIEVGDAVEYSIQLVVVVHPAAPEDLQADMMIGSSWITFSWQQSNTRRGIPPLSRHIILVSDREREWNLTQEGSQAYTNVTGLLPGTEYSLRVVAVSTSGDVSAESPASMVLTATTLFSAPAPECTVMPTVVDTRLVVMWKYAHTGGLPITNVSVQFQKDTANLNTSFSSIDSSEVEGSGYMVDGGEASIPLPEAGIRYRFFVTVANIEGTTTVRCPDRVLNIGKPATPNTPEVDVRGDDNKMVILTVTTLHSGVGDNTQDNFQFMFRISEAGDSSGVTMRELSVACTNGGGPCVGELLLSAGDLRAGKTYFVRARAFNRYGVSEFSGNSEPFSLDNTIEPSPKSTEKSSSSNNTGAVVGGIIGALVILALTVLILVLAAYIFLKLRSGGTYKVEGGNSVKVEEVDVDLGTALGDMSDGGNSKELQYADLEYFRKAAADKTAETTSTPNTIEDEPVQYATIQEINGKTVPPTAQSPPVGEGGVGGEGDKAQTSSTFV